jgi:hypothetical protein
MYFERSYSDITNDLTVKSGSITFLSGITGSDSRVYWEINDEEKTFKMGNFDVVTNWHTEAQFTNGKFFLTAHTSSLDDHTFEFGSNGITFTHNGSNPDGIKYGSKYSSSLLGNPQSLPDVETVRLLLTQSLSYFSSSLDPRYERKGSGIYSSSGQLGPTGMYSGSGTVPRNTIVNVNNVKFQSSPNSFSASINSQYDTIISEGLDATDIASSGSYSLSTGQSGDSERSYLNLNGADNNLTLGYINSGSGYRTSFVINQLSGYYNSGSESTRFTLGGPDGVFFQDNRTIKRGIEYDGNYTASIIDNDPSLANVGLVKKIISGSLNGLLSGSSQVIYNQISSISSNIVSGSEQLTSSYDSRYHRLGTGLFSSSQQVNYTQLLNIPAGILSSSNGFISSSNQIDYDTILNKLQVSGSGLYRLLISSGSASSSYANERLTFDTSQNKLNITASLFLTGSSSTRMSYIWDGPKTVGATPGIIWTNMPYATSTWLGSAAAITSDAHYIGDFTEITQGRLFTALAVAGTPTSSLFVQYSLDGITAWGNMVGVTVGNVAGFRDSGWVNIPAASKQFVYIRLVGLGGDGALDPRFSPPIALFR